MKTLTIVTCILLSQPCFSQNWIDTTYEISTVFDLEYGSSIDFKGADYILEMDVSFPVNDSPPECGRPLMIVVHGGAWYGGDKGEGYAALLRDDFAKRGYVTASVNYRLGLFNTNQNVDCALLAGWKCWNMTDSSEWYRANYRAIQDIHGAIRYLVNDKETYHINPDNLFLAGESAGGFIVLGAGFIDDQTEVIEELISGYPDAPAPNPIYENDCIQAFGIASSIAEMYLGRPSLGPIGGNTNLPVQSSYRIRGVGSFYGGAFNNIFETKSTNSPALYLFHQPCDLIVPFTHNKLLAGYSSCATGFPTFCQHITNRPFAYGSKAIATLIDEMALNNIPACEYMLDYSSTNYSCLEQVANPNLACHNIDDYWQRTTNMATYFSDKIAVCPTTNTSNLLNTEKTVTMYPNPTQQWIHVELEEQTAHVRVRVVDVLGKVRIDQTFINQYKCSIGAVSLKRGYYQVWIETDGEQRIYPIIKI